MKNIWFSSESALLKRTEGKKVILVDFFDTLVFRRIHSFQIFIPWARALNTRIDLKEVTDKSLVALRAKATATLRKNYQEPPYENVMEYVWKMSGVGIDKNMFISHALAADIAVELGCQYGNKRLIHFLRTAKQRGQRVFIVSDFYLPSSTYKDFLINARCEDVIDGIFTSETCNKTKHDGTIYQYVLEKIDEKAEACVMIGDSKHSDVIQAKRNGIDGFWYFPLLHKIRTNISRKLNLDYSKSIFKKQATYLYKNSLYDEYALVLYSFAQKLITSLQTDRVRKVAFVSRGGYFLKKVVDEYIKAFNIEGLETAYCYASRKVCLTNDEKGIEDLKEYLEPFLDNGRLVTVDEGWYCHSQQAITKNLNIPTVRYYIGVRGKDNGNAECESKGILFDYYANNGKPSKYYGFFCTNCSTYEQMLTSREGSVKGYIRQNNELKPILKENETEIKAYDEIIASWQSRMLLIFRGLCAWNGKREVNDCLLAKMVLRTALFANNDRCDMLNRLDLSKIDNYYTNTTIQVTKGVKDVKIDLAKLMLHPDMYIGMFCKIQRRIYKNTILNSIYKAAACLFAFYTKFMYGVMAILQSSSLSSLSRKDFLKKARILY